MHDKITLFVKSVADGELTQAVLHIYSLIDDLTGNVESIQNVNRDANVLTAAVNRMSKNGISSCKIPLPPLAHNTYGGDIIIKFDKHGAGHDANTVLITIDNDSPVQYRKDWYAKYQAGEIQFERSAYNLTWFFMSLFFGAVVSITYAVFTMKQYPMLALGSTLATSFGLLALPARFKNLKVSLSAAVLCLLINSLFMLPFEWMHVIVWIFNCIVYLISMIVFIGIMVAQDDTFNRASNISELSNTRPTPYLEDKARCPSCNAELVPSTPFCVECGAGQSSVANMGATVALNQPKKK